MKVLTLNTCTTKLFDPHGPLKVGFLSPNRERCGISDYSRTLLQSLSLNPQVLLVGLMSYPTIAPEIGHLKALMGRSDRAHLYRSLGQNFARSGAAVVHIQHEYSLFGGIAPHRNHATALYDAVNCPTVLTVHEIARPSGNPLTRGLINLANRQNFIHSSIRQWIVHTGADKARLVGIGVNETRISVIPIAIPKTQQLPIRQEARERLGITARHVITLFGFISAKKSHDIAVDAMKRLPEDTMLLIAGDRHPADSGSYVPELMKRIEASGIRDRVRITGFLEESQLPLVMAATDVAVAPYRESSGSASVAMLLAYGVPTVTSDIPTFTEILSDAPGVFLTVPVGESDRLAEQLSLVLEDHSLRDEMNRLAHSYAAKNSPSAAASATICAYLKALK